MSREAKEKKLDELQAIIEGLITLSTTIDKKNKPELLNAIRKLLTIRGELMTNLIHCTVSECSIKDCHE